MQKHPQPFAYVVFLRRLSVAGLLLLNACGGTGLSDEATMRTESLIFSAELSPSQETPPERSAATGVGLAIVDADSLHFSASIVTTGITDAQAKIAQARPGESGPVLFVLDREPSRTVWNLQGVLTPVQRDAMRDGNFYFNVASAAFPGGEIRGQIAFRLPSRDQFTRLLQAAQESRALQELLARAGQ